MGGGTIIMRLLAAVPYNYDTTTYRSSTLPGQSNQYNYSYHILSAIIIPIQLYECDDTSTYSVESILFYICGGLLDYRV